jgi:hypothetical protein
VETAIKLALLCAPITQFLLLLLQETKQLLLTAHSSRFAEKDPYATKTAIGAIGTNREAVAAHAKSIKNRFPERESVMLQPIHHSILICSQATLHTTKDAIVLFSRTALM